MKFYAATLSNNTDIYFKEANLDSAELYGEWRAERMNLELVDIREITESEMKKNAIYTPKRQQKYAMC